jgi:phosphate transport system protein
MRERYHEQLDLLVTELADLCHLAGGAILAASRAVQDGDLDLAEQVIRGDTQADEARTRCEQHAHTLLALQSPVATDLRTILAATRIAERLERMGDLAVHVAESVRRRHPRRVVPAVLMPRFAEMGRIAGDVAFAAEQVIRTPDLALARRLDRLDDDMDDLHRTLFTVIGCHDWSYGAATAIDLSLLSRFYERYADHAVSVARQAMFAVTGHLTASA